MTAAKSRKKVDTQILLFRQLTDTWALIRRVMEPRFSSSGLSSAQWGVLRVLIISEEEGKAELMPSELSQKLIVRPPSITGVLDRLQRQGLITRRASQTDRRVKRVRLTDAGRQLVTEARERYTPHIKELFAGLNKTQQRDLHRLLGTLTDHLQNLAAEETD